MIKWFKRVIISISMVVVGVGMATTLTAQPAYAAPDCSTSFLGVPTWYEGLTKPDCSIKSPNDYSGKLNAFIWRIVLNVIEAGLVLVAYAAAGYIIYGGFKYLTSAGFPDRVTSARKIIQNAIIGLVISFLSIAIVNLVSRNIG